MNCAPLPTVKHRIRVGVPLPFSIRNADGTLLLARGKLIEDDDQLEALFDRGALVDSDEVHALAQLDDIANAPAERLPALWDSCLERVSRTLRAKVAADFQRALSEASTPVLALIERDPDLAIFQVVRQDEACKTQYGVKHAVHSAIAGRLAARRLGWAAADVTRLFKAALTMNISIVDLQAKLAMQVTPLTQNQREALRGHSARSVEMLETAGVTDGDWIAAVADHHPSEPDGASRDSQDPAALLNRVDRYTAKLSARVYRGALQPDQAARALYQQDGGHPMSAALIKEFGIYPPGTYVQLQSGELGIVVKRGEAANAPIVAALTNRAGEPLMSPVRRHCTQREHAVVAVIDERRLRVRVPTDKLVAIANS